MELREELQVLNKDGLIVSQYFMKTKAIIGYIVVMGEHISDDDLLLYVLKGV